MLRMHPDDKAMYAVMFLLAVSLLMLSLSTLIYMLKWALAW